MPVLFSQLDSMTLRVCSIQNDSMPSNPEDVADLVALHEIHSWNARYTRKRNDIA